jgi:hypothetical protein
VAFRDWSSVKPNPLTSATNAGRWNLAHGHHSVHEQLVAQAAAVFDRLEALLGSVAVWETEDDVGLPTPFADGKALGALQTVADVVRPTQGRDEPRQGAR